MTPAVEDAPHCTCGGGKGFRLDESSQENTDPDLDLWVCVGCGKPTEAFLEGWLREMKFYSEEQQWATHRE